MAYRIAHIGISGWFQRVANGGNGVIEVFDELYGRYAGPDTLCELYPWYIDPREIGLRLAQLDEESRADHGERLLIQLFGFSFGGQTAANVADSFPGLTIDCCCLSDAVARWGRLGWLRAANPLGTIHVPRNVIRLTAFVQRHSRLQPRWPLFHPAGHRITKDICLTGETREVDPIVLDAQHTEMDNHQDFHDAVLSDAAELHRDDPRQATDNVQCDILPFPRAA